MANVVSAVARRRPRLIKGKEKKSTGDGPVGGEIHHRLVQGLCVQICSFKNYQFNKEFTLKYKYFKIGFKGHNYFIFKSKGGCQTSRGRGERSLKVLAKCHKVLTSTFAEIGLYLPKTNISLLPLY